MQDHPIPNFLARSCVCELQPLLVTDIDAARLLAVDRWQVGQLIADGKLTAVELDDHEPRVTLVSVTRFVSGRQKRRATFPGGRP